MASGLLVFLWTTVRNRRRPNLPRLLGSGRTKRIAPRCCVRPVRLPNRERSFPPGIFGCRIGCRIRNREEVARPVSDTESTTCVFFADISGPGGRRFKSFRPDHFKTLYPQHVYATLFASSGATFCVTSVTTEKPNPARLHHSPRYAISSRNCPAYLSVKF